MMESQRIPGVDLGSTSEPQVVRILVKNPWQKEEFLVHKEMLVRELKEHVGRHFSSSPDHVHLVYTGRILKDHRTLSQHGLHLDNDATVHVVLRSQRDSSSWQTLTVAASHTADQKVVRESSTFARDRLRELTASLGLNTANFAQFQSQLMSKPEVMLQLLENPFIQSKLSSPDLLKELVTDNPQVRQVMQRAPEISHFFSSPEGLRLVVALARNPAAVREIIKTPPQALLGFPGSAPSGDNNGVLADPLAGLPGLIEKAVAKRIGTPLLSNPSGSHQIPFDCDEKVGRDRDHLSLPKNWPPKLGAQNGIAGVCNHSKEESHGALRGEAGQLASSTVKNLLHQIIKHLVQNMAGGPSRTTSGPSPIPGAPAAHMAQRKAAGSRNSREQPPAVPAPTLLHQIQSFDLLLASWSPKEIQGLLDIQHRLQALTTDEEPVAERRGRSERPARRAHSITSLCDLGPSSPCGESQGFSAQQVLHALIGSNVFARAKNPSRPRGSSAQPSAKQKRMYQL